jgi:hypothetical protein
VRFVHALLDRALAADVAGLLGARLGSLISLDLSVAPGFVIGTAAWHLSRLLGEGWELPATVAEEVRGALDELDGRLLTVRPAPAVPSVSAGPPWTSPVEQLETVLGSIVRRTAVPTALIVQARTSAEGKPPSGHGWAFTRDPLRGTVWPVGEFRSGRSVMSLDELSRWTPAAGLQLRAALSRVESLQRGVSEVSFTLEAGRLWIDDARPAPHSRAAAEHIAQAGLTRAPAAGPGS